MKIGAVIQARMTSRRCPGKVLRPIAATTLLGQVVENLSQSTQLARRASDQRIELCVATSRLAADDGIERFCDSIGVDCYRGSLDDVAGRLRGALDGRTWTGFARISGDSPLIDYRILDEAISRFVGSDVDLVTNVFPRSFPRGQSVEVLRCDTFIDAARLMHSDHDREHVTPVFYRDSERFRIENLSHSVDCSSVQLAVDTEEDYSIAGAICNSLSKSVWEYPWPVIARLSDDFRSQSRGVAV